MSYGPVVPCGKQICDTEGLVTAAGKIFRDPLTDLTVRCIRSGSGLLSVGGRHLVQVEPVHGGQRS
jgi:hypothetical protein